nr:unnamed protein product [Digitaria exilis]
MDLKDDDAAVPGWASRLLQLRRVIRKTPVQCLIVASHLALSFYGVSEEPRRLQLMGYVALCDAVAVALTLFARWLDASTPEDVRSWKWWMKLAARMLASLVMDVPNWLAKSSTMPTTLLGSPSPPRCPPLCSSYSYGGDMDTVARGGRA